MQNVKSKRSEEETQKAIKLKLSFIDIDDKVQSMEEFGFLSRFRYYSLCY